MWMQLFKVRRVAGWTEVFDQGYSDEKIICALGIYKTAQRSHVIIYSHFKRVLYHKFPFLYRWRTQREAQPPPPPLFSVQKTYKRPYLGQKVV